MYATEATALELKQKLDKHSRRFRKCVHGGGGRHSKSQMPPMPAQRDLSQSGRGDEFGDLVTGRCNSSFGLEPACIRDAGASFIRERPTIAVSTPSVLAEPVADGATSWGGNDGVMPGAKPVSKRMACGIAQLLSWFQRRHEEKLRQLRDLQYQQKVERRAADRRHHEMLGFITELKNHFG
ncbi:hypothetical protein V7S43_009795 [Phytophthora oleae]|uniref:Uncharacterized protein n=1 Tax=Phytophthora oleae TaxID=2107226 RepID=A0ABD3FFI3_9STRA